MFLTYKPQTNDAGSLLARVEARWKSMRQVSRLPGKCLVEGLEGRKKLNFFQFRGLQKEMLPGVTFHNTSYLLIKYPVDKSK